MTPRTTRWRRALRRPAAVAAAGLVVAASLVVGTRPALALDPVPLRWDDEGVWSTLEVTVDADSIEAGDAVPVHFLWTHVGPTPFAAPGDDPMAACEGVLDTTFTRTIGDWQPTLILGTSTELTDYAVEDGTVTGPIAAAVDSASGTGTERIRPESCLEDGTAVARTVREYDVTYTMPDDLADGTYAAFAADFGFPAWWSSGDMPTLVMGPAPDDGNPAVAGSGAGSGDQSTATTVPDDDTATTPTTTSSVEETATTASTAPTPTTVEAPTTSTTAATDDTTDLVAAGADGAADDTVTTDAASISLSSSPLDTARMVLGVGAALVGLAITWRARKGTTPRLAARLRTGTRLAALAGLAGVGMSVFMTSFDTAFIFSALAVVLCLVPPPPGARPPERIDLLDGGLRPGASVDEVRRHLERTRGR